MSEQTGISLSVHGKKRSIPLPMFLAAAKFALRVAEDMGMRPERRDFFWAKFAADTYGGNWSWARKSYTADRDVYGWYDPNTEAICLNRALVHGDKEAASVLWHELAHRLMYSSRYEGAWEPGWEAFDPDVFQECVAVIVGLLPSITGAWLLRG